MRGQMEGDEEGQGVYLGGSVAKEASKTSRSEASRAAFPSKNGQKREETPMQRLCSMPIFDASGP